MIKVRGFTMQLNLFYISEREYIFALQLECPQYIASRMYISITDLRASCKTRVKQKQKKKNRVRLRNLSLFLSVSFCGNGIYLRQRVNKF